MNYQINNILDYFRADFLFLKIRML